MSFVPWAQAREGNPIGTPPSRWTSSDIPDLTGTVAVVTGANCGIGFETAKELARKGTRTVLACRGLDKAQAACVRIQDEIPNAPVRGMALDLASLRSVRQFADAFADHFGRLDVLINNAGIMMPPQRRTEDGFESQLGVNHLGHFALTGQLLPLILDTPWARVVTVSSLGHSAGRMDFENLMFEHGGYAPHRAYGRSKLANLLFAYELQRRFAATGATAKSLAAHPGFANTRLFRFLEDIRLFRWLSPLLWQWAQSAAMGALPSLRAATDPAAEGGQYFGPGGFMAQRGYPVPANSNAASHDEAAARRLWRVSEALTGVRFAALEAG